MFLNFKENLNLNSKKDPSARIRFRCFFRLWKSGPFFSKWDEIKRVSYCLVSDFARASDDHDTDFGADAAAVWCY